MGPLKTMPNNHTTMLCFWNMQFPICCPCPIETKESQVDTHIQIDFSNEWPRPLQQHELVQLHSSHSHVLPLDDQALGLLIILVENNDTNQSTNQTVIRISWQNLPPPPTSGKCSAPAMQQAWSEVCILRGWGCCVTCVGRILEHVWHGLMQRVKKSFSGEGCSKSAKLKTLYYIFLMLEFTQSNNLSFWKGFSLKIFPN